MTVRLSTLPNGMRVATVAMEAVETASIGVWVGVGTRHEQAEVNGVAHFLEHMVFKGTERRSARGIAEEIEAVGGYLNAHTAREQTAFYAKVLKDDTALAFDIIADILQHSAFDPDEVKRERAVVLQEIGQALDTPDDIIFDHFQSTAFPDQAIGRPVLGSAAIVEKLDRGALMGYLDGNYGAKSMVLAAAGRVDHDAIVELAKRGFAKLPGERKPLHEAARYTGGEYREDRELEQVHLVLGFPAVSHTDPDYYTQAVLATMLGGGMSSRLFQEVREKRGLAYSIYSFASSFLDSGLFGVYAGTGEDEVAELTKVVAEQIRAATLPAGEEEVRRARAQIKAGLLMSLESTSARAEQAAGQLLVFDRIITTEEIVSKIDSVTGDDMARVARRIFAGKPTLAAMGPLARLPSLNDIGERLVA